jgi:acyl-CoA synthetase (AMP-forming)/AMP-acid ligase II
MNRVEEILQRCVSACGDRPILVSGGASLSCADFDLLSRRLAASLANQGIGHGDTVAIFLDNSFEAVGALFAAFRLGAIACPIDSLSNADEVAAILNATRAACLFTESRLAATAALAMAHAPMLRLTVVSGTAGAPAIDGILRFEDAAAADPVDHDPGNGDDIAIALHVPGAAPLRLSHRDVLAAVAAMDEVTSRGLLPLSSRDGVVRLLASLGQGQTLAVAKPFALPDAIRSALRGERRRATDVAPARTPRPRTLGIR